MLVYYPLRMLLYYNVFKEWGSPRLYNLDGSELSELRRFHNGYRMRECIEEIQTASIVMATVF